MRKLTLAVVAALALMAATAASASAQYPVEVGDAAGPCPDDISILNPTTIAGGCEVTLEAPAGTFGVGYRGAILPNGELAPEQTAPECAAELDVHVGLGGDLWIDGVSFVPTDTPQYWDPAGCNPYEPEVCEDSLPWDAQITPVGSYGDEVSEFAVEVEDFCVETSGYNAPQPVFDGPLTFALETGPDPAPAVATDWTGAQTSDEPSVQVPLNPPNSGYIDAYFGGQLEVAQEMTLTENEW